MHDRPSTGVAQTDHRLGNTSPSLSRWWRRHNRLGDLSASAILLSPVIVLLAVFTVYPIAYTAYLSVVDWDGWTPDMRFVGFANYVDLWRSGELVNGTIVTLLYSVGVTVGSLALGLLVALLINSVARGATFYRAAYFMPVVTATVAVSVVWTLLLDPASGLVNVSLRQLGADPPAWLRDPNWALPAVIGVGIWKRVGFNVVIFLAGLRSIPVDVYEAAEVDGAESWSITRFVTLPLLSPMILLAGIMGVIDSFLVFDQIFIMTGGGPVGSTETLGLMLYRHAFNYFNLGKASAIGWVMFLLMAGLSLAQWKLSRSGAEGIQR